MEPSAPVMEPWSAPQSPTQVYLNPDYVAQFYSTVLGEPFAAGKLETLKKRVIDASKNLDRKAGEVYGADGNTAGELALKVLKNVEKYRERIQKVEGKAGMHGSLDHWGHLFNEDKKEV